jgi:hypothetical protein
MGDLVETFMDARQGQINESRRATLFRENARQKSKNVLDRHYDTVCKDIALALYIVIQKEALPRGFFSGFIDRFCEFRETYAVAPNKFEAGSILENLISVVSTAKGQCPLDRAFDKLISECYKNLIPHAQPDLKYRQRLSEAQNTSNALQLFAHWCEEDESRRVLDLVTLEMASHGAEKIATRFAKEFTEKFITVSIPQIKLNTQQAVTSYEARSSQYQLEARCLRHNLRLVVNR